jgi:hypothetical protein
VPIAEHGSAAMPQFVKCDPRQVRRVFRAAARLAGTSSYFWQPHVSQGAPACGRCAHWHWSCGGWPHRHRSSTG